MKSKKEIAREILQQFDFVKVYKVMDYLNWTWESHGDYAPTVGEIYQLAESLIFELLNSEEATSIATGGFRVYKEDEGLIALTFELDSVHSYESED